MTVENGGGAGRSRRASMDGTHRARSPRSAAQQRGAAGRSARSAQAERNTSERRSSTGGQRAGAYRGGAYTEKSYAGSGSGRHTQGGGHGGRKNAPDKKPWLIAVAVVLLALICIGLALFFSKGRKNGSEAEETTETMGEALPENAVRQPASIDVSAILPESAEESSAAGNEAESTSAEGETKASANTIQIQGLTPDEIREKVAALYQWDMTVYNDSADVGATVKPTVDANETTEAATLGDAENPDSSPEEGLSEDAAQQEITVASEIKVPDLVAEKLDALLSEIESDSEAYKQEAESSASAGESAPDAETEEGAESGETAAETPAVEKVYVLSLDGLEEAAQKTASDAATMWYQMPRGGSIGSYDKENDKFVMEGAKAGFAVDEAALTADILEKLSAKDFAARIKVPGEALSAEEATAASEYRIIASYTTKTTNNSVRNKNIALAAAAINGTILKPGEEFSFNNVVGQRTEAKGYGAAAAYNEGEVVQEVGGGICQVSTTLYNAVLRAGLKTTKRQSHTFEPSYVTPGRDATVSWGGPDYRFANVPSKAEYANANSYSIGIRASYANREITVSIYGRPVLKDGYSFDLKSTKVKDIDVVRKLIEPGSDKTPTHGTKGSQWVTNLVVKKGDEVVSDKLDHNTYYSGHIEYYTDTPETSATETPAALPSESETAETLPTETLPPETTGAPQYETGVNGGPGVIISGGGQTAAAGPGEVGPGVSQTEAPRQEEPQQPSAEPAQTPDPTPAPAETGAPAPQPGISDGPISDAPPAL